ncbi:hypothetical protein COCC4DRAFT_147771 [Bipolaris maydis ATCC 48331]|uniref:Uncharacterized protein n=2 Tax=Cochliobolus heterostrophus TaxID=5016 RepID=M2UMH2_COCH5|nr:uncharacterized protein COCC4DRAFT_147771 [Bipolaris maydis ATCC 48331]EMD94806.1 hypothetical protein COCHEDRAFT_1027342 [Bipolaris maydis C5]KAJ5029213.1 hypothetical protein J3E73DRAFT_182551 [Bipolaris maydis]ENI01483.1 hypothetical protein COCC4DRAFT_147771 [Bipolaris maydis ATCC 48331]KAJ6215027.1 hypothetical protein PSV09DRAFT_1027342 [Bipolaris maydis]KAJ6276170.1 hypothetical protein PSV08DRAFT_168371 [Bipolaris maydis]
MRSWRGIYRTLKRTMENAMIYVRSQLSSTEELVFSDVLALYAVSETYLYEALIRIVGASLRKTVYVNPTNGVEYHGWDIPGPDQTAYSLLAVQDSNHEASLDIIERLRAFIKGIPGMRLEFNPLAPLVCDMLLYDEEEDQSYHIEHKFMSIDRAERLLWLPDEYRDHKLNGHFLLKQVEEDLVIYTRSGRDNTSAAGTEPHEIKLSEMGSESIFAKIIRANGPIAKARLDQKWSDVGLYDDTFEFHSQNKARASCGDNVSKHHATVDAAQMGLDFGVKINQ